MNMSELQNVLKKLSQSLECAICGDFFTAPVMSPCCHTFCSVCIRRTLSVHKAECPACRLPLQESQLLPNRRLEETVKVLKGIIQNEKKREKTPQRKPMVQSTETNDTNPVLSKKPSPLKKPTLGLKQNAKGTLFQPSAPTLGTKRKANGTLFQPSAKRKKTTQPLKSLFAKVQPKVVCPGCGIKIVHFRINTHLDKECPSTTQGVKFIQSRSREYIKPKIRKLKSMPALLYQKLSLKEIRAECEKEELPTHYCAKNKEELVRLHRELRIRVNAECDSLNPRSKAEIVAGIKKETNAVATSRMMDKFKRKTKKKSTSIVDIEIKKRRKEAKKKFQKRILVEEKTQTKKTSKKRKKLPVKKPQKDVIEIEISSSDEEVDQGNSQDSLQNQILGKVLSSKAKVESRSRPQIVLSRGSTHELLPPPSSQKEIDKIRSVFLSEA